MTEEKQNRSNEVLIDCDYLVVGAGASSLAFLDTLLTELPETKVILIDKKKIPGGHWVDAYGYVRLHHPSIVYGLASRQLEGNWLKCMLTKFTLPFMYRSNKNEIVDYFGGFVDDKVASGQVDFYPNSVYDFNGNKSGKDGIHCFSSVDGSVSYKVKVHSKLVDGTRGECMIPHDCPLPFPVDEGVCVMTPNQIYDTIQANDDSAMLLQNKQYVVLGAGKTGMDCIVYLQSVLKIDPSQIAWVISQDVWMLTPTFESTPWVWPKYLAVHSGDQVKAALELEKKGLFTRLDETILPSVFRYPVIQPHHLELLRNIKNIIRRGRATAIRRNEGSVTVDFGSNHSPWVSPSEDCVFVHATSPGLFNDKDKSEPLFASSGKIILDYIFAPPIGFMYSCMAKLEAARVQKRLDVDAMKSLAAAYMGNDETSEVISTMSENDLLRILVKWVDLIDFVCQATITEGIFFAILDKDPVVTIQWMKENRLSLLSNPFSKSEICDKVRTLLANGTSIGLTEGDIRMLKVVSEKIKPLEGM